MRITIAVDIDGLPVVAVKAKSYVGVVVLAVEMEVVDHKIGITRVMDLLLRSYIALYWQKKMMETKCSFCNW